MATAAQNTDTPLDFPHVLRAERLLGRTDWSAADYYVEGLAEFDRHYTAKPDRFTPARRREYASKFVHFHCPRYKLTPGVALHDEGRA